jgi:superfamily II DNA helicase RecQ
MRGESPVVQIIGMGGDKSILFILPAYYSYNSGGITIIIVPLVSLWDDLYRYYAEC